MLALFLGFLLTIVPSDSPDNLDRCLAQAPAESPPPIRWTSNVEAMWTANPPVPPDTLRASLRQVRKARECFLNLDPSEISRPYLDNVLRTFDAEAALLAGLRRFTEAFEVFEKARAFLAEDPPIPSSSTLRTTWPRTLHQNQGYLQYLLGDLSASIEHYLNAYKATPETVPKLQVRHLLDIGILHQRIQDYNAARDYYQRAEQHLQNGSLHAEDREEARARTHLVQADLLLEQTLNTQFDQNALKRVRDRAREGRRLTDDAERHARLSSLLSESLGYLGEFEEAYRLNAEVRQYARANDDARVKTLGVLKLGTLHVHTEQWARADSTLHDALVQAETLDELGYQRRTLQMLGRMYETQGRWTKAEEAYRRGVAVIEEYRQSLTASQWSLTAFAQWREVYRGLARSLLAQDRPREALAALDRSRARHLQDLRIRARVTNQLSPSQRARLDSLTDALSDVRTELGTGAPTAETHTREASLMAARQQLLSIDSTAARPALSDIQASLDRQDRILLSYFIDDPSPVYDREAQSTVFVVTPDSLRAVSLPNVTQQHIGRRVQEASPLFANPDAEIDLNAMHFNLRPLHRLQKELFAPIASLLPSNTPLTVVPDGPLFRVPFSMLVRSMPEGRFAPDEARFVLHEHPTSLELASSLVPDSTPDSAALPSPTRSELAAFGVSTFDTLRTLPAALRASLPRSSLGSSSLKVPDLPGVQSELQSVRRRVADARVFLNDEATEDAFQKSARHADVLHLASHAFVHSSSPLQNAFLFHSDSTTSQGTDGVLFLHELQTRQHPFSLVVLSGCNTARGALRGGEGMEGLQYAFRAMGSKSTVSSLWPVHDEANSTLMDAFYRHLRRGVQKDEALRRAKLDYLETHPDRASPFFWAPTVLYGSPAPLDLGRPAFLPIWAWWSLGLLVVGLGGLLAWRWREPREHVRSA